jgi:hypothetical protein
MDHGGRKDGPARHGKEPNDGWKESQIQADVLADARKGVQQTLHLPGFFHGMTQDQNERNNNNEDTCPRSSQGADHGRADLQWRKTKPQAQQDRACAKGDAKRKPFPYQDDDENKNRDEFDQRGYVE